jgi:hypothetical protein
MIKGMRDVMDGEESAGDVDELEDDAHDATFSDGGYVESGDDEEPEVTCASRPLRRCFLPSEASPLADSIPDLACFSAARPDYEQGEGDVDVDELGNETEDDEIIEIAPPAAGHADEEAPAEDLEGAHVFCAALPECSAR